MALATTVTGSGNLVSKEKSNRQFVDPGSDLFGLYEITESEVREWVALTESAAETAVANTTGNALMDLSGTGVTYSSSMSEDNRVIGSYIYICSAEKKSISATL